MASMSFRPLLLALALTFGLSATPAPAVRKPAKVKSVKKFKPKKDPRYSNAKVNQVKPRKFSTPHAPAKRH
jgi:hypothetical protein